MFAVAGIVFSAYAQFCQKPPDMHNAPENLSFSQGIVGTVPQGWDMPQAPVYKAEIVSGLACHDGPHCATLFSTLDVPSSRIAFSINSWMRHVIVARN
jgi:hypothetical protein